MSSLPGTVGWTLDTAFIHCRRPNRLLLRLLATLASLSVLPADVLVANVPQTDPRLMMILTNIKAYRHYDVGLEPPKVRRATTEERDFFDNVCPTVHEWKNLTKAITVDNQEVEVIQNMFSFAYQWFYTVSCDPKVEAKSCRWIDEQQAPKTVCKTKLGFTPAIVKVEEPNQPSSFDWKMIRIPAQCVCYRVRSSSPDPFRMKLSAVAD